MLACRRRVVGFAVRSLIRLDKTLGFFKSRLLIIKVLEIFTGRNSEVAGVSLPLLRGAPSSRQGTHDSQFLITRNAMNRMFHKLETSGQRKGLGPWSHDFLNAAFMLLNTPVLDLENFTNWAIEGPMSSRGAAKH